MIGELTRHLKRDNRSIEESSVPPTALAELVSMVEDGVISGKIAKEVFDKMYASGKPADRIIAEQGLKQISDEGALEAIVNRVLEANPKQVDAYRSGKEGLLGFFVGQVMRETKGQANPQLLNEMLRSKLRGE